MAKTKTKAVAVMERKPVPTLQWAVPQELGIPPDPLRCRIDFFHQAVQMTFFEGDFVESRIVSANDIAIALATELSYSTGMLPENTLWWQNTRSGPLTAIYVPPAVKKLALQEDLAKPAERYTIPLPGLVFLAFPARPPRVYAVKSRPTKETDKVYHAPLLNMYADGRSCPGSHSYPNRVADIPESFFVSFFTHAADRENRSNKYPEDILGLWKHLNGKQTFPLDDLVELATIADLLTVEYGR